MYCTKCGVQLRDDDCYCSKCGARTALAPAPHYPRALMLNKRNKKIAGVCAGFARYMCVDVTLVRVLWLGVALGTGVGFLVYLVAWIAVPADWGYDSPPSAHQVPATC
jgi:phage shock protein C